MAVHLRVPAELQLIARRDLTVHSLVAREALLSSLYRERVPTPRALCDLALVNQVKGANCPALLAAHPP